MVIAVAVGAYLKTKRNPKVRKWAQRVMYIDDLAASQAVGRHLKNFEVMGEFFSSGSVYKVTSWALTCIAACLAGTQLGEYLSTTIRPGDLCINQLFDLQGQT